MPLKIQKDETSYHYSNQGVRKRCKTPAKTSQSNFFFL